MSKIKVERIESLIKSKCQNITLICYIQPMESGTLSQNFLFRWVSPIQAALGIAFLTVFNYKFSFRWIIIKPIQLSIGRRGHTSLYLYIRGWADNLVVYFRGGSNLRIFFMGERTTLVNVLRGAGQISCILQGRTDGWTNLVLFSRGIRAKCAVI